MRTDLDFEEEETKKLLSKLSFKYFLERNLKAMNYRQADIDSIAVGYGNAKAEIDTEKNNNKKQFNFFVESRVRKMFHGGHLPAVFQLDKSSETHILDFIATGEDQAYFEYWQRWYKRKMTKEKIWDFVIKIGSILAFLLSFIKLAEYLVR